jgi:hypothetical protein
VQSNAIPAPVLDNDRDKQIAGIGTCTSTSAENAALTASIRIDAVRFVFGTNGFLGRLALDFFTLALAGADRPKGPVASAPSKQIGGRAASRKRARASSPRINAGVSGAKRFDETSRR